MPPRSARARCRGLCLRWMRKRLCSRAERTEGEEPSSHRSRPLFKHTLTPSHSLAQPALIGRRCTRHVHSQLFSPLAQMLSKPADHRSEKSKRCKEPHPDNTSVELRLKFTDVAQRNPESRLQI